MNEHSALYSLYKAHAFWNVPASFTSLVGRKQEIDALSRALRKPEIRLLTLLGPGGIGKTRLSMQIAHEARGYFSDGVCFVGLASIDLPERVLPAIAEALNIPERGLLFEQVTYYLSDRQMLLILDNFEQVVEAAPLLEDLLAACPMLKLLVTSRETLRLQAEHEYPVSPLALPSPSQAQKSAELTGYSAIALFVQRARAVQPGFQMTPTNAQTIAELCTRLDGLPLAIELAAARTKLLSPEALLKRLSQRFEVLTGGARTSPERHRTLYNAIKWSYDLLNEQEQWLFRHLSIFVGGWMLKAAEIVCAEVYDRHGLSVLDGIASLMNKSLLLRVELEGEEPRLLMLTTIREFGLECLREHGEMEQARMTHAAYFLSLAEEAEPNLKDSEQLAWLTLLEQEHDNLRAALERLIAMCESELALRLTCALAPFWFRRGYWSEGRDWLAAALNLTTRCVPGESTSTRAKALNAAGNLATSQSNYTEARRYLEESISLYRQTGDDEHLIDALSSLGSVLQHQGDLAAGYALEEESIALARKLNKRWELAWALFSHGNHVWMQNHVEEAIQLTEESLAIARELHDISLIARITNNLAYMAWQQKDLERAAMLTKRNLQLARQLDDKPLLSSTLETFGSIAMDRGNFAQAKAYFLESIALAKQLGRKEYPYYCLTLLARIATAQGQFRQAARLYGTAETGLARHMLLNENEQAEYAQHVANARSQLGEKAFSVAWKEGQAMTVEQALASLEEQARPEDIPALLRHAMDASAVARSRYPDDLTPREVEVLRLLAHGWTDAQIAEYLVISPRTVNKHTTSIYSKIAVTTRSAATRYAIEKKLA